MTEIIELTKYQIFHIRRINNILLNKDTVMNPQTNECISKPKTDKEKLEWILSSLFEIGLIKVSCINKRGEFYKERNKIIELMLKSNRY